MDSDNLQHKQDLQTTIHEPGAQRVSAVSRYESTIQECYNSHLTILTFSDI